MTVVPIKDFTCFQIQIDKISGGFYSRVKPKVFFEDDKLEEFIVRYYGNAIAVVWNPSKATWLSNWEGTDSDLIMMRNQEQELPKNIVALADYKITINLKPNTGSLDVGSTFAMIASLYDIQAHEAHSRKKRRR